MGGGVPDVMQQPQRTETSAFKEAMEELEKFAVEVIMDKRRGLKAALLRTLLGALSLVFRVIVAGRHALFRNRLMHEHNLGCLVISIGNLTVGGTGKTPVVELLARTLHERGRQVAILSRGYKSKRKRKPSLWKKMKAHFTGELLDEEPPRVVSDGLCGEPLLDSSLSGDEPWMLASNLPGVAVVVDKNRVAGGSLAIRKFGADTLLLDDGLQYLRLRHRLDIVLVDRTAPFGTERLLPRGTLREPRRHLRRASYIFLTKCDGSDNSAIIQRLRKYNRVADIIECNHRPVHLQNAVTRERVPLDFLKGLHVGAISGIAVPESFEAGLVKLGAHIEYRRWFTDHHRYTDQEIADFIEHSDRRALDAVITTEKDFVRFPKLVDPQVPVYFLRVEIEILKGHEAWEKCIERICHRKLAAPAAV